jgi:hypothetical protein
MAKGYRSAPGSARGTPSPSLVPPSACWSGPVLARPGRPGLPGPRNGRAGRGDAEGVASTHERAATLDATGRGVAARASSKPPVRAWVQGSRARRPQGEAGPHPWTFPLPSARPWRCTIITAELPSSRSGVPIRAVDPGYVNPHRTRQIRVSGKLLDSLSCGPSGCIGSNSLASRSRVGCADRLARVAPFTIWLARDARPDCPALAAVCRV